MRDRSGKVKSVSRYMPEEEDAGVAPSFTQPVRKAVKPEKDELKHNVRSRSARMRVAIRTDAPCWEQKGKSAL